MVIKKPSHRLFLLRSEWRRPQANPLVTALPDLAELLLSLAQNRFWNHEGETWDKFQGPGLLEHRFIQPIWHQFGVEVSTTLNFVSILACWSWLQISWQRISQIEHRVYRKKAGPLLLVIYSVECTQVWSSARWLAFVTNAKGNCGRLQQDGSITRPFLNPTKPADN